MSWFLYSVALPVGLLLLGSGVCVLYWLLKHGELKEVAKSAGSFIEEGSVAAKPSSAESASRS